MATRTLEDRVTALENTMVVLEELPGELAAFRQDVSARFERLEGVVREGDERNYVQMRMLHEDLVARIALISEGDERPRRKKR
jgi:hypothetical protein